MGLFSPQQVSPIYSHQTIVMLLIVHLIVGYRRLRDVDYYRDDEMLKRLPDVSTISRSLHSADEVSVKKVRGESRNLVIERLSAERLSRVTFDFDGSVLSTGRHAEGTAVGFNKKKRVLAATIPCFEPLRRPSKYTKFITGPVTSTIPMVPMPSSPTV